MLIKEHIFISLCLYNIIVMAFIVVWL
jgi:hypothetical protein